MNRLAPCPSIRLHLPAAEGRRDNESLHSFGKVRVRSGAGPVHLLVTDVIMPGMNGSALAQKLTSLRPEMRVVYMSGYTGFRYGHGPESHANLLPKPFNRETLLRKLRDALTLAENLF